MTSRSTRATITVFSVGGLVLLGILMCGLNAARVSAQRIPPTADNRAFAELPIVTPTPIPSGNTFQPTRRVAGSYETQSAPYGILSSSGPPQITVTIKGGPELRGELTTLGALQLNSLFGPVAIPLDRIAGVRIADDVRQPATFCLTNGDSLSGVLETHSITIKTEWGTATIDRDHIVSIVTTSDAMTWQQREGRWRLVPIQPVAPATETSDTIQQGDAGNAIDSLPQIPESAPAVVLPGGPETPQGAPSVSN